MAKEEKKETVEEEVKQILPTSKHKVKKAFTLDKFYGVGSTIELPEGKTKDKLISNKFI